MTGTGSAITNTPLNEQMEPKTFPAIVLGTMSPYLQERERERERERSYCLSLRNHVSLPTGERSYCRRNHVSITAGERETGKGGGQREREREVIVVGTMSL